MRCGTSQQCGAAACRAVIHSDKCLLFEPSSASSRKFLDILCDRLRQESAPRPGHAHASDDDIPFPTEEKPPPFELEVLEAALMVATGEGFPLHAVGTSHPLCCCSCIGIRHLTWVCAAGRLDAELTAVSRRVSGVLLNLPRDITPVNLEELRRVKQCLVELESKADNLRCIANGVRI